MNTTKKFIFTSGDTLGTPVLGGTSLPIILLEKIGMYVNIAQYGTGVSNVEVSPDGVNWYPVDNQGSPLVLTNNQIKQVSCCYAFRVVNVSGNAVCVLNNPFA